MLALILINRFCFYSNTADNFKMWTHFWRPLFPFSVNGSHWKLVKGVPIYAHYIQQVFWFSDQSAVMTGRLSGTHLHACRCYSQQRILLIEICRNGKKVFVCRKRSVDEQIYCRKFFLHPLFRVDESGNIHESIMNQKEDAMLYNATVFVSE